MDQQAIEQIAAEVTAEQPVTTQEAPPPAPEETTAAAPPPAEQTPKMVPWEALLDERTRRQAVEGDYKKLEGRIDQLNQYLAAEQRQAQQPTTPKAEDPGPPDYTADPAGHLKYWVDKVKDKSQTYDQYLADQKTQHEQGEAQRQFLGAYASHVQQFVAAEPAYVPAFNHWLQTRSAQLAAAGLPADMVQRTLVDEERFYVATALQNGRNPAETMFNVAKAIGWQPAAAVTTAPVEEAPRAPNGQFAAKPSAAPPKSLSHAAGTAGGQHTLEAALAMNEKDWDKAWEDGTIKRMMRGR